MFHIAADFCILAENGEAGGGGGGGFIPFPFLILGLVLLFWLMIIRPERQKQKGHQARLAALKKNDRIVTVGGIYGTVMNVNREGDEITLKVDEATNTKLRVTFGSIARVVSEDEPESASGTKA